MSNWVKETEEGLLIRDAIVQLIAASIRPEDIQNISPEDGPDIFRAAFRSAACDENIVISGVTMNIPSLLDDATIIARERIERSP